VHRPTPALDTAPLRRAGAPFAAGLSVGRHREVSAATGRSGASVFRIASLTKPVTALATLRAADHAHVPLDTPVVRVLPTLAPHWNADLAITIADVLSQTSGLTSTVTAADVAALGDDDDVALETARLVVAAGSSRRPGRRFEYDNGNYFLAGAVTAALHGTSYEQAVHDLVLNPAGMTGTSFEPPPNLVPGCKDGHDLPHRPYPRGRRPSGGLCSSVDDLLTFAASLLADSPALAETAKVRTAPDDEVRYGLGWAIGPSEQLYLNGRLPGYRAAMLLLPADDLAGVVLVSDTSALPAAAAVLSAAQRNLTGDDLTDSINRFAA